MSDTIEKKQVPPYVPYSTYKNFITSLKDSTLPSHIDRSVMSKMSGSGQAAMVITLRNLELITSNGEPTDNLKLLVEANEAGFGKLMHDIVKKTYGFIFESSMDLTNTTAKVVEDKFRDAGASGSTLTKCIAFFLAACKDSNISVSKYVKAPKLAPRANGKERKKASKTNNQDINDTSSENEEDQTHSGMEKITVPLKGMDDGIIYFPANLTNEEARKAVKMANFILKNFYDLQEDEDK